MSTAERTVTPEQAAAVVGNAGGGTSASRGADVHEFVRKHGFTDCLELGFAHGVGSVYIASALEAAGAGKLTCVDTRTALDRVPTATELLGKAGLEHRVELVHEDTSYTWYLHDRLREQLRPDHTVEPLYDFVFLDGAHTWDVDGLTVVLVEKLLKPGGYLLLDDVNWYADHDSYPDMNDYQRSFAQVGEVLELLIQTNPIWDEINTDGEWAFIRKSPTGSPQVRTIVRQDMLGSVREIGRLVRRKLRR